MAAALFNAVAPAGWAAGSAGTEPGERVRAEAVAAMREVGLDISGHRPTALAAALGPDVALIVGLCAEEACPTVPGVPSEHWPLPNPAGGGLDRYRAVRDELTSRVRALASRLRAVEEGS
jgi:arsenate reductase